GGGFATRELYTDAEEAIFNAQRPGLLNGIEELATRADLLDRSVILYLPTIPENKRRSEEEFWKEFAQAHPRILGALLTVVAEALRNLPTVKLNRLPRMADFATWATAAEPALGWKSGTFMAAYTGNRREANELALEASPVAAAVRQLIEGQPWEGTASALLTALSTLMTERDLKAKTWPKTPRTLSNTLRRLASNLRAIGIEVSFSRGSSRLIRIARKSSDARDVSDAPPEFTEESTQKSASQENGSATQAGGSATQNGSASQTGKAASDADSAATQKKSNENKACVDSVDNVAK